MFKIVTLLLLLSVLGCESRPIQQSIEWVVRDAWDPVCAKSSTIEKFEIKNAGWASDKKKVWTMDVKATFKPIKDCFQPLPKLTGPKGHGVTIVNALKPKIRKAAFRSYSFEQKKLSMIRCDDSSGKSGWALQELPTRCWTGPTLFDETAGVKPVDPKKS